MIEREFLNAELQVFVTIGRIKTGTAMFVGSGNTKAFEHNTKSLLAFHKRYVGIELSLTDDVGYF